MPRQNLLASHLCWLAITIACGLVDGVGYVSSSPVDEPNFNALRDHLAFLRHERGWSYDELAARSGVGRATLVALESGKPRRSEKPATEGTLRTWFRIAQAFDLRIGDLVAPLYTS
ncbi:helix-turn-helix transcriptional regulator [Leucobacter japonicus]|uniref:helix-turn-helix transcriptional regulator n=1 Tax=Leucobacter japonicus TaxID=1461259 RepID=UPI0019D40266|nr:helix-turn-helix transcriptional regulator [Leucobacter japonicus]